ncbi:MAG TPA: hypothetical protein VFG51_00205 [Candidatus Saccharimonadia bacterium]|nr:hypothetical protein [Candidatus Saccharimonadia bacterium]
MATCNPNELAKDASCFFCLPPGYYYPVKLAILARILKALDPGADTSPAGLMADAAAACIACPPQGQLGPIKLALICDATGGGGAVPIPPSNLTIDLTSTDTDVIPTWTNNGGATNIEVWKSVNGGAYALYATIAGAATNYHDPAAMNPLDYWEYQVRAVGPGGNSAFSNKAAAANGILDQTTVGTISYPYLIISFQTISINLNVALLTVSFPELLKITAPVASGACDINDCPNLTSVSIPKLQSIKTDLNCTNDSSLVTIDFSSLVTVGGDLLFSATSVAANFPALTTVGNINFSNSLGGSFSAQALTTAGTLTFVSAALSTALFGALTTATGMDFSGCNNLSSVSFTVLATVNGNIDFNGDPSLLGLQFPALTTVTGFFNSSETSSLATASFPSLATVGGDLNFSQSAGDGLAAWSLPALTSVGGDLRFNGTSATSFSANALTSVAKLFLISATPNLASISCSSLVSIGLAGIFDLQARQNPSLASVTFTSLQTITGQLLLDTNALTALSFPALVNLGQTLDLTSNPSLVSASFPVMSNFTDNIVAGGNAAFTTWNAPVIVFSDTFGFVWTACALTQASVDQILHRGVVSATTSADYELAGGTNSPPTLPCVNPLSDCFALQAAGNTVNTN